MPYLLRLKIILQSKKFIILSLLFISIYALIMTKGITYESKLEGVPDKDVTNDDEVLDNSEQKEQENTVLNNYDVPILGEINAKSVSLPLLAVVMGFVDGFNPCALWILIFLISELYL